jgi:AcrR family transcriptional regulator
MSESGPPKREVSRPKATAAEAHTAIIDAVYELLQVISVRDLTMERVAREAGVGKPTLYRWWKTKPALVMAMFRERIVPQLDAPGAGSIEQTLEVKVERLISAFQGFFGKVIAELIAEGQSHPEVLEELKDGYLLQRRASTVAEIEAAQVAGQLPAHLDAELMVDSIFGSIYFHLLLKVRPLSQEYGKALLRQVLSTASPPADPA